MTAPIVPPFAPAFVAETSAMLARRFDSLDAYDQHRVPGGGSREAFVAAMLDATMRASVTEIAHPEPIGPVHMTVAVEVGATPNGGRVVVLRRAHASGRIVWCSAITSQNDPSGWRYLSPRPTRRDAEFAGKVELSVIVRRHARTVAP